MHSLRTKMMMLTVCVILIAVTAVALLSVLYIQNNEHRQSDQMLLLMCETGERNLDYYFSSVQRSVAKVSSFAEKNLEGLEADKLERHLDRVGVYFEEIAYKTNGVLTYYYRIDPAVSDTVKGFWYTNLDGTDFVPHEVTDITLYDTQDTTRLVWFTVPKYTGKPVWLPPYTTDNLDVRVFSYNVPIYWKGQFIGVVGMEIDYSAMADMVDTIRLFNNGYAFLNDSQGNLFYHPRFDVSRLTEETAPKMPEGVVGDSTFLKYTFEGVEKQASWLPLCNGMRLTVSVPVSETVGDWRALVQQIIVISVIVLVVLSLFTMYYTSHITKPLDMLTRAAEQVDKGNYDFSLDYEEDDEVGRLTSTFRRLASNMKDHIIDLNKRAYLDALTAVKNKGAFTEALDALQQQANSSAQKPVFAVGMFDCDNLKTVNDAYGHDKGDIYLKTACGLICRVFQHSPVFRVGGDEFAVILKNADFINRDKLVEAFHQISQEITRANENAWDQVHITLGIAVYDPEKDKAVIDTVHRADAAMYENKRKRKQGK